MTKPSSCSTSPEGDQRGFSSSAASEERDFSLTAKPGAEEDVATRLTCCIASVNKCEGERKTRERTIFRRVSPQVNELGREEPDCRSHWSARRVSMGRRRTGTTAMARLGSRGRQTHSPSIRRGQTRARGYPACCSIVSFTVKRASEQRGTVGEERAGKRESPLRGISASAGVISLSCDAADAPVGHASRGRKS